jgi:hypothetical protein
LTAGGVGRFGGMNDQCGWYSAPAAIQRLRRSFCAAVSVLFADFGGIRIVLSSGSSRATSSLASGSLGTMAPISTATSRRSSRRSALREALSGPWQAKQFSDRIGRMSRLNSIAAEGEGEGEASAPRARDIPAPRVTNPTRVVAANVMARRCFVPVGFIGTPSLH